MVVAPFYPPVPLYKVPPLSILAEEVHYGSTPYTAPLQSRYRRKDAGDLGPGGVEPKSPPNILLAPQPW